MARICEKCGRIATLKHKCPKQKSIDQICKEVHRETIKFLKEYEAAQKRSLKSNMKFGMTITV